MQLYYLVNSLELNSIFTTESISPISIITGRNFSPINSQNNIFKEMGDVILLFEEIPEYPNVGNSDTFAFKTIFELELNQEELYLVKEGVWCIDRTVYLTPNNLKNIYIYDDVHGYLGEGIGLKQALQVFERNRYTKMHHRYMQLFDSANNLIQKEKKYSLDFSNNEIVQNSNIQNHILVDSILNSYKGALYSFLLGNLGNKSTPEIEILKNLEEIKNTFAIIKNRSVQESSFFKKGNKGYFNYENTPFSKIEEFKSLIKKNIKIYSNCFKVNTKLDYEKYEESFLKSFSFGKNDIFDKDSKDKIHLTKQGILKILKVFIPWKGKSTYNDKLKEYAKERLETENPYHYCISLYNDLLDFPKLYTSKSQKEYKEEISDEFSKIHRTIERLTKEQFLTQNASSEKAIKPEIIEIDSSSLEISLGEKKRLNKDDTNLFLTVCNEILKYRIYAPKLPAKLGLEYFRDNQDFLIKIGKEANFRVKNEEERKYKQAYGSLFNYMIGKEATYNIDLWDKYPVQQNLAAFFFKPSNISELQEYLESKKIKNKWIAYVFWGLFNGFSRIDQTFIKPLFVEGQDITTLNELDNKIKLLYDRLLDQNWSDKMSASSQHKIGDTVDLIPTITSSKAKGNDIDLQDPLIYTQIKKEFEKIIENCLEHSNKTIKKYFNEKRKNKLFDALEKRKNNLNPHFIEANIFEILKDASISKKTKAYIEVINYRLSDFIREINEELTNG